MAQSRKDLRFDFGCVFWFLGVLLLLFGWGDSVQTLHSAMEIIPWVSLQYEVTLDVSLLPS